MDQVTGYSDHCDANKQGIEAQPPPRPDLPDSGVIVGTLDRRLPVAGENRSDAPVPPLQEEGCTGWQAVVVVATL